MYVSGELGVCYCHDKDYIKYNIKNQYIHENKSQYEVCHVVTKLAASSLIKTGCHEKYRIW